MDLLLLGLGFLLILGTGFFVAVEFSLVALDQPTVAHAMDRGDKSAPAVMRCLKSLSTQLSSCQLGITLTTLLTGYVAEPALGALLAGPLDALGVPEQALSAVSLTLALIIATMVTMIIGELVPKNLAIAEAYRVARVLARPQLAFTAVFRPLITVLNGFSNKVLHRFGLEVKEELSGARTPEELSSMVRRSAMLGTLEEGTATFLDRTLRFSDQTAADVMTPRPRMASVDADASLETLIDLARQTGFSRFPVLGESVDDVRGVTHVKKAVAVPREKRQGLVAATVMSEITRVPETIHLDALLPVLREASLQVAIVEDEYGGTSGVVTLEDLIEEIVGEVADEHDRIAPGVLQSASGDWFFPGLLRPDEINAQILELSIPEHPAYETVAGFMLLTLGRVAGPGDAVEVDGGRLVVVGVDGRRIDRLCFSPDPQARDAALQQAAARAEKLAEDRADHVRHARERGERR
ncbi:hemolysin family protein [Nesterenkonia aurantiaca]|uniref:CBS domain containing-hemolysin-like protein n=1 Tax=Nesterenkonia aurantiaca TaxID=1436010 RepID=A0A4R7G397_9MICC|nr:hemolysin family protein [Nesterenkonia aurantiaca]TDS85749.1 CBS domain containing-hemolysin-like protein [Nesterenkonia aurantiaca]